MYEQRVVTDVELKNILHTRTHKDFLSANELAVYDTLHTQQRKAEWLQGRIAVKSLISGFSYGYKKSFSKIEIYTNDDGCPYVSEPYYVSISHKGGKAIAVISRFPIGVDYEIIQPVSESMQEFYLTDGERRYFTHEYNDAGPIIAWTIKESFLKATGKGFKISPKSFSIEQTSPHESFVIKRRGKLLDHAHIFCNWNHAESTAVTIIS